MMRILRACVLSLAGLLSLVPQANSQTIEIYAGGATFRDTPSHQMPVVPATVAVGPDGMVYVSDAAKGLLVRFDPVTNTATALPGLDPQPPYYTPTHDFSFSANALAVNPSNELFGADSFSLFRINVPEGTRQFLTDSQWPVGTNYQMTFDANGTLYYLKRDNAIYSATGVYRRGPWGFTERLVQGYDNNFHGDGGPLSWAGLGHTRGVALDAQGNLYLADSDNNRVRKIAAINGMIDRDQSIITTVAGNGQVYSYEEGVPATSTGLADPEALAVDAEGNLYIHERGAARVRRVSAADGTISTYAGNGNMGYSGDGGPATSASIDLVFGNIAVDAASNLYLANMGTNRLRRVDAATAIIETVLGNGTMTFCTEAAPRRSACLGGPQGVAVDAGGNVFVSDSRNLRIRKIDATTGELRTIAGVGFDYAQSGDGGPATAASFGADPGGISFDPAGNLLIAGTWANNVRRIHAATGVITTIAGTGTSGFSGDGGPATAARFGSVQDVVSDAAGNIYLTDTGNRRIRRISASGIVSTIAGNGSSGFSGDGGPATAAALDYPTDIKVDASGNVLFVDTTRLRRINATTGIITTIAGNGTYSQSGDGGLATSAGLGYSFTFLFDGAGNIIVMYGGSLRRIDAATGIINSINPPYGLNTEEGMSVHSASAMAFSPQGALFVTDPDSDLVFRIDGVPGGVADTTPPSIAPVINGDAGVEGWYRSNVSVNWTVTDPESPVTSSNGCSATSVTSDTFGVTFTCSATSGGGTSTQSVTVRRDTVAPTVSVADIAPGPDALGWINTNVAVHLNVGDALSGVYSTSPTNPLIISQEGTGITRQLVVTDRAGNSATYTSPSFNIDLYPPTIGSSRPFPQGNNGWYTGNVQIDWSVNEPISPIRSQTGCDDPILSTDTTGTTFTCTATSAGGTISASLTLKRDATPPTLVFGPPSPAPNAAGWNNGDVSFPFTTSDGTSGVASTSSSGPVVIAGEGTGLTATVTVTDVAGNSASFTTPAVNIARSAPAVQAVIVGTLGSNGWYTSNVQISWNVTGSVQSSSGCVTSNVTTDTAGVTFTCTATSAAGSTTKSVTVKRDATPPVLTFGTPSPVPNANGWNKTNVSISFTRSDALSGLASTSTTSPLVLSTEGAALTGQVIVTDVAGNAATFTSVPRNIDKTAPVVAITNPANGANYGFYQDVVADFSCTDLSLLSCIGTTATGELVNTKTAGARTYKVTGKDLAGFTTAVTNSFTVESLFNFEGFLAPASELPVLNLVTRGSLVPIRFRLPDGNGGFVSSTASFTSATVATLTCGSATAVPLNDTANGAAGIDYDASTNTFTYNWQTTASWTGCRKLTLKLKDNSTHELRFKFQ